MLGVVEGLRCEPVHVYAKVYHENMHSGIQHCARALAHADDPALCSV